MSNNTQKNPITRQLPEFTRKVVRSEMKKQGMALPGKVAAIDGAIVTVNFLVQGSILPVVQMPLFGPEYIRYPIQVGDLGVAYPVDTSIALIAGLGTDPATLDYLQGNLSTLVWFPIGSAKWSAVDPQVVTIYGPGGVTIRDQGSNAVLQMTPTEGSITVGGHSIVVNSSGVFIDGIEFMPHSHSGVSTGSGDTGPVVG